MRFFRHEYILFVLQFSSNENGIKPLFLQQHSQFDPSGNIIAVGYFQDIVDFDPTVGVLNSISNGGNDFFVQKYDDNGNFLWAKTFGGISADGCRSVSCDANGNIYLTGIFSETVDFDPGPGVANYTANGNSDIYILKLDTNGVQEIKERLANPNAKEDENSFILYIEKFIERVQTIRKEATVKQYRNGLAKLKEYERTKRTKLTFEAIDHDFYNSFVTYCMKNLNLSTNSIGKLVKNIKLWMGTAHEEDLHSNLIYKARSFKKPVEDAETIYLNEEELQKIRNVILPNYLDNVRDIFLLACYTGVRSQDYGKLNKNSLINDGTMLKVRTEKTDEEVIIPLHPIAKGILEKYNGTPRLISNQKFNKYIKMVCQIVGITETVSLTRTCGGKKVTTRRPKCEFVSSHTARRSFATNAYKAGVPSLAIMAITGHRTEKVFLKYIRVSKEEHASLVSQHGFFQGSVA